MHSILRPLALVAVFAIIIAAVYLVMKPGEPAPVIVEQEQAPVMQVFRNDAAGITLSYPDTYVLTEHDEGTGERTYHAATFTRKEDAAHNVENGEGPPTITVLVFDNSLEKLSVKKWIENTSLSNYKLSTDGVLSTTTVSTEPASSYVWDGLYRGESTVIAHKGHIVMFTVTYMDSAAPIRDDFRSMLASVTLD